MFNKVIRIGVDLIVLLIAYLFLQKQIGKQHEREVKYIEIVHSRLHRALEILDRLGSQQSALGGDVEQLRQRINEYDATNKKLSDLTDQLEEAVNALGIPRTTESDLFDGGAYRNKLLGYPNDDKSARPTSNLRLSDSRTFVE